MVERIQTVAQLEARLQAERAGQPFLVFYDDAGRQLIVTLVGAADELPIGRQASGGIRLAWDPEVSRVHALLHRVGDLWTVLDDGLSRNGTFVNGERIVGRRTLRDGDVVTCGSVAITFRDPVTAAAAETLQAASQPTGPRISPAQRRVLVALCRPLADSPHGPPATNKAIAAELTISVESVKTHLRRLGETLGVEGLPQNRKRSELAWRALSSGVVTPRDLLTRGR